jgi:hypothetical protein
MNQTPATFSDFSQFTIQKAVQQGDRTLLKGRMTKPGRRSVGEQLSLFITIEDDVQGIVTEFDPDAATAVLSVVTEHLHPAVVPGASFPVYDNYWVGKLHLVLDDDVHWTRMQFVAPDAFVEPSETPGWRKWRIATPEDESRTDGQIVKGGWDHEHCELCWQKIGDGGEPNGYFDGTNNWVCDRCYNRFIGPRDLRFVLDGAWDDSDDPSGVLTKFQQINRLVDEYDLAAIRQFVTDNHCVDARSKYGWTPLMLAASHGHQSLVALLLDLGADVNAVSEQHGYTALALAAQKGFINTVQKLLDAGASVQLPEKLCGGSLLTYVKTGPGRETATIDDLLTKAGAK